MRTTDLPVDRVSICGRSRSEVRPNLPLAIQVHPSRMRRNRMRNNNDDLS